MNRWWPSAVFETDAMRLWRLKRKSEVIMKKKLSVLALPLISGVALLSLAADSPASKSKSADADTVRELRTQIIELRAQVETLRQRTQTLESSVEDLKRSHVPVPLN